MGFGWLLDRLWVDFGSQVGAKLAPKSVQKGVKTDVKNDQKNDRKKVMQGCASHAGQGGWVP